MHDKKEDAQRYGVFKMCEPCARDDEIIEGKGDGQQCQPGYMPVVAYAQGAMEGIKQGQAERGIKSRHDGGVIFHPVHRQEIGKLAEQ